MEFRRVLFRSPPELKHASGRTRLTASRRLFVTPLERLILLRPALDDGGSDARKIGCRLFVVTVLDGREKSVLPARNPTYAWYRHHQSPRLTRAMVFSTGLASIWITF